MSLELLMRMWLSKLVIKGGCWSMLPKCGRGSCRQWSISGAIRNIGGIKNWKDFGVS